MALSKKQMEHPMAPAFFNTANELLVTAMKRHQLNPDLLQQMDVHAGRVVDEITALLLRAEKMAEKG